MFLHGGGGWPRRPGTFSASNRNERRSLRGAPVFVVNVATRRTKLYDEAPAEAAHPAVNADTFVRDPRSDQRRAETLATALRRPRGLENAVMGSAP
jgi:hypothetical protein